MLGTPPAFILSQDQTLVKSVCVQSEITTSNFIPFTVLRSHRNFFQRLFWIYSLKNFQVCVVVYCLIIKVLFCFLSLATAILEYHISVSLSTTFFIFLKLFVMCLPVSQALSYNIKDITGCQQLFSIFFIFLVFSIFLDFFLHFKHFLAGENRAFSCSDTL